MRYRSIFCLSLLLFLIVGPVVANDQVQIYPLQHRSAADILGPIEALLGENERVSAARDQVVLIASSETQVAAQRLIALLDRPLRQFWAQVRWIDTVVAHSGRLTYDGQSGQTGLPGSGVVLGTSPRQAVQQLRVSEGESVFLMTGQDIPYAKKWAAWSGSDGQGFAQTIDFQKVRTGFTLSIDEVRGDELKVQITPQLMSAGPGSMLNPSSLSLERLSTQIQIEAGQWVDLAAFLPETSIGLQVLAGSDEPLPVGRLLQLRVDVQK